MITELKLCNFKSFVNLTMPFSPLTILTGKNASGKSSVIQAIRMIKKSCGAGKENPRLDDHVQPNQLKSKLSKDSWYSITMVHNLKTFVFRADSIQSDDYKPSMISEGCNDLELIQYISANRFGPRNQLPILTREEIIDVGEFGEYVISFIDKNSYSKVPEKLRLNSSYQSLKENIDSWLSVISTETRLTYDQNQTQNVFFPYYNGIVPTETGYGLSSSLPIISSLLYSEQRGRVLLIENPEINLHPSAQEKIGELIALSVSNGQQVIVETHSDHIIDGIRIAAKQARIQAEDVMFAFFVKDGFDNESRVVFPKLSQDGRLSFWPDGFFDQSLIDKAVLAGK